MSEIKIGVYVCECGINIASKVDVEDVTNFAAGLPNVTLARASKYTCSEPGQNVIQDDIRDGVVNRVVVASCSPASYESIFRECLKGAGLNPYLLEMANMREHCSWVTRERELATWKAKDIVNVAVSRARWLYPQDEEQIEVTDAALLMGQFLPCPKN